MLFHSLGYFGRKKIKKHLIETGKTTPERQRKIFIFSIIFFVVLTLFLMISILSSGGFQ